MQLFNAVGQESCEYPNSKHSRAYDILPPSRIAIVDYAIGLQKLSANEQFFVGSQMAVIL